MSKLSIEARVGAFVLLALVVLAGFIVALGDISLTPGVTLHADFAYTGGLQAGAPVMTSGVRLGKVKTLRLLQPSDTPALGSGETPRVRVELAIDPTVLMLFGAGVQLHVATQGALGESFIEVTPGHGPAPAADTALRGTDAPRLHLMALQVAAVLETASTILQSSDGRGWNDVAAALAKLLATTDSIVTEHRESLSRALTDLAGTLRETHGLVAEVRRGLDGGQALGKFVSDGRSVLAEVQRELPTLAKRAQTSLAAIEQVANKADAAIDTAALTAIVRDVQAAAERLRRMSEALEHVAQRVRRGEGTVGGLVQDPQVYDDLKEMLRDLKQHPWKFLWRD